MFSFFNFIFNTNSSKFLLTWRELKGLEAQVIRCKHNLSTNTYVGKALIEENGYSLQSITPHMDLLNTPFES